jgi:hypothetical protein
VNWWLHWTWITTWLNNGYCNSYEVSRNNFNSFRCM